MCQIVHLVCFQNRVFSMRLGVWQRNRQVSSQNAKWRLVTFINSRTSHGHWENQTPAFHLLSGVGEKKKNTRARVGASGFGTIENVPEHGDQFAGSPFPRGPRRPQTSFYPPKAILMRYLDPGLWLKRDGKPAASASRMHVCLM